VRLIEVRLLEGPNVYRLEPVAKLEVAVGRRRTWYGQREPGAHALVRLGASVPARLWPDPVASIVAWVRRLRSDHDGGLAGVTVHRSSDPGHWIVTWPWTGAERARTIAEAAYALAERDVSPARRARLTGAQARLLARHEASIEAAGSTPPAWLRDDDRRIPIISISGTNGKSTVTRLITHILMRAGRRVGSTTSDGVLVNERMVDPGDWTGPGGAAQIVGRRDVDVAVLETARGGIVLRGMGYESNEASVLTNVSSDHLDLQGIHTLPELAEVKATICRITRPDGWVVLNADDPHVATIGRRVRARVAFFSIAARTSATVRRHLAAGGRVYAVRRGALVELNGAEHRGHVLADIRDVPIAIGGLARHNVANALAAAGGARALGATIEEVGDGLRDFQPSTDRSPGRLNIFRLGSRIVIVDFAHNEAGVDAILDVAEGIAGGAAGRAAPITVIIGTAGDRPDDTLRGIGRIAARRAQRIAIKETLHYLRGRSRESLVGELMAGIRSGLAAGSGAGRASGRVAGTKTAGLDVPVYRSETVALRAELNGAGAAAEGTKGDAPRVIVLMCHEERVEVFGLLRELGARPVDVAAELTALVPRLQDRPRS
jgi:cyanophycin synthetase